MSQMLKAISSMFYLLPSLQTRGVFARKAIADWVAPGTKKDARLKLIELSCSPLRHSL